MAPAGNPNLETVLARFSQPRMARYVTEAGGDVAGALELYARQAQVASALWQTIGHVEVVVRNAMHDALSAHSADWLTSLELIFNQETKDDIAKARGRAAKKVAEPTPGHVVAELNFGFWRFLLSKGYDRFLWVPFLHNAFPEFSGRRDDLFNLMRTLNDARNAIAHHQRVPDPARQRRGALELAGYVCPEAQAWIRARCTVTQALSHG